MIFHPVHMGLHVQLKICSSGRPRQPLRALEGQEVVVEDSMEQPRLGVGEFLHLPSSVTVPILLVPGWGNMGI